MAIASGKLRQSIILISIVGIATILLAVYFFIYVKDKEYYVNKRNFKELAKSAMNIRQKILVYKTKEVTKNFLQYNLEFVLKTHFRDKDFAKKDSADIDILRDSLEAEIKREKAELSLNSFVEKAHNDTISTPDKSDILAFRSGVWQFVFRDALTTFNDTEWIGCDSCKKREDPRCYTYFVASSIPVDQFIKPLLQRDIFNEFVLVNFKSGEILYESHPLGAADSIRSGLKSFKDEIQINGVDYKIFPFKFSVSGEDWVLIGLQNIESYLDETRSFDRSVSYTIVLVAMIILMSLPWIKVILISKNEKLNKIDVTLCGLSILLACFLWTVIIISLDYDGLYKHDNYQTQDSLHLQQLASKIEKRFTAEITSAYEELRNADSIFRPYDVVNLNDTSLSVMSCEAGTITIESPRYKSVELIFWIDSHGEQKYKWTTREKNTRKIDVSSRQYFVKALENSGWPWPDSLRLHSQKIVLESIRSWNNAGERAVISMPTKNTKDDHQLKVVSVQIFLRSVIDCVMPPGYKFCIADQNGEVWFHSDAERNLRENFFEECSLKYDLNNILYSNKTESTVIYENRKHDFFIKPLKKFPLFLITMKDLTGENQSRANVMEVTFVLVLGQVFIIMLTILIIWLTWSRSLRMYPTHRSPDWLKPDDSKIMEYVKIALLNVAIGILFTLITVLYPTNDIVIFFLTPLYILPVYYLYLNNQTASNYFKPLNRVLIFSILFLVICSNFIFIDLNTSEPIIWYQIFLVLLIAIWLLLLHHKMRPFRRKLLEKFDYKTKFLRKISLRTAYSLAISSLFLIIAIVPAYEFHRQAFNLERIKNLMVMQYGTVKEILNKPEKSSVYLMSGTKKYAQNKAGESLAKHIAFDRLSALISPILDSSRMGFLKRDGQFHTYIEDKPWNWSTNEEGNILYVTVNSFEGDKKLFPLQSRLPTYNSPSAVVWIAGMLGLLYLFLFSRYLITRIFIFDINRNLVEADMHLITTEAKKKPIIDGLSNEPLFNNHLFIIGLPFSGKRDYVDKLHPPVETNRFPIDLVDLDVNNKWNLIIPKKEELEKYEVILIDHFEYDFQNTRCNNSKLLLLEKLFLLWKKKIVILSTIHPTQVLDQYKDDIKYSERWNAVLSHFYKIFYPLEEVEVSKNEIMKEFKFITNENWNRHKHYYDFIERECCHGLFLQNLRPTMYDLVEKANKNQLTIEELSDKVKSLAYMYYASIWASCSKDERFLIYDLAEDGLVNVKNADSIIRLIYKGIFKQHRTLSIMNRSFRNFVLSHVTRDEVLAMRKETLSYGAWSSIKGPILFVFVIALLFLLYTQRGLANEIMAFLGALLAAIPVFLRSLASVDSPIGSKRKTR